MKINIYFVLLFPLFVFACSSSGTKNGDDAETTEIDPAYDIEEEVVVFDETKGAQSTQRNFYFLFDGSGSMDENCSGQRKIDGAKSAIAQFLKKVPNDANIGLSVFGVYSAPDQVQEIVPLAANNRDIFQMSIFNVEPDGGTPLSAATKGGIDKLVEQYKKQLGYGEYRLIIVTDGLAHDEDLFKKTLIESRKYPFIAIYGIGLCMDGEHVLKKYSYSYTDASNYDELGKALEETLAELPSFDEAEFIENE